MGGTQALKSLALEMSDSGGHYFASNNELHFFIVREIKSVRARAGGGGQRERLTLKQDPCSATSRCRARYHNPEIMT